MVLCGVLNGTLFCLIVPVLSLSFSEPNMSDNVSNQRKGTPFPSNDLRFRGEFALNADHLIGPQTCAGPQAESLMAPITTVRYRGTRAVPPGGRSTFQNPARTA